MNRDHYPFYGVALLVGAALAVKGMGGMHDSTTAPPAATPTTPPVDEPKRR